MTNPGMTNPGVTKLGVTKLGIDPTVHETALIENSTLGRYVEIDERCHLSECSFGDYSYMMRNGQIWCAQVGKFANIASDVRINATNHPMWRATQHHFVYRAAQYFDGEADEAAFFDWRRADKVTIGHDVWIGHGATILPGVSIGDGAVIGAGAVVAKDVAAYSIVAGVPAKPLRARLPGDVAARMQALAWWDWSHEALRAALADFRSLEAIDFLAKYEAKDVSH